MLNQSSMLSVVKPRNGSQSFSADNSYKGSHVVRLEITDFLSVSEAQSKVLVNINRKTQFIVNEYDS